MVAALGGVELVEVSPPPRLFVSSPAPLATHILGTSWKSRQQIAGNPRKWLRTTGGIRVSHRGSGGVARRGGVDGVATYFAEPHNFCAQQKTFARSQ